jgi:hypothetical protein
VLRVSHRLGVALQPLLSPAVDSIDYRQLPPVNRDREGPHGRPPPTPPDIRGTDSGGAADCVKGIPHPNRSVISRQASREFIPGASVIRHLAGCDLTAPLQATTPIHRSGLRPAHAGLLCRLLTSAGRSGRIAPPSAGHPADLPWSVVIPSVHQRRIYQVRPNRGWRAVLWRASSPRAYHTA